MKVKVAVLVGVSLVAMALVGADLALAQAGGGGGGGEEIGSNIGELLSQWATEIYLGIVAIVGLVFLLNQRYAQLAVFVAAAMVVGIFVTQPDAVSGAAEAIGNSILGGGGGGT